MKTLNKITPQKENFAKWYVDVVKNGELMEYGLVKGTIIFKPNSFGIWENIQRILNEKFKQEGVENVYLPMLIPTQQFQKEKNHIAGFNPELATITKVGDKELPEHIYIRPTSEVLFADLFRNIISEKNELPILFNQWANVLRWEKTTNPFLRNSEFLWQEGHTVHDNAIEARKLTRKMLSIYAKFIKDYLAIPTITGKKTPREKFAGACTTYTVEAMMKDGKALQSATSHYLAQNFSKPYDIKFKNKDNEFEYVYQTSWGVSTRLIGAIIMNHGDDRGVIIPPLIANTQIDILTLFSNKNPDVSKVAKQIFNKLIKKYRVKIDDTDKQPGFKAAQSEIQGVPIRIEVGPRDLANNQVSIVRRDTLEKTLVDIDKIQVFIKKLIKDIQDNLYKMAKERLDANIVEVNNYKEFKEAIAQNRFVIAPFEGEEVVEEIIQKETGATSRCILIQNKKASLKKCIYTSTKTKRRVLFAKSY
ncbi:Proline--tRNA ligase [Mycoplasmopsis californica]|uniref:Proline--tRNA ligase n=1 Tax=Mycoplasmopsis equigenitalium TaxID=114883 RepID=A0ABY5J110_9BACT|nr:proline--tRNA ligase [Mycoplasmopsis equigenitalium]UUD36947.1 proline--tRNA ligase [Mycoplasmopsis equigenitalium]VEU69758.1 Proline--tRNA ligase [Mycoplasmopsis californica]